MLSTSIRFSLSQKSLEDFSLIKVTGADRESFFQGQVTNDLSTLAQHEGQLTARLNRSGKLQSIFFIAKLTDCLFLLCPKELSSQIKEDFEKFIIMDDVILENISSELWLRFNYFLNKESTEPTSTEASFNLNFYGLNAGLYFTKHPSIKLTNEDELEDLRILNGWPKWGVDITEANFINDSYLNEIAISYKKGCFLGQETVAKIENNRGAAYYPVLLKLDKNLNLSHLKKYDFQIESENELRKAGTLLYQVEDILQVLLFRDFRVTGRKLNLIIGETNFLATVMPLPFYTTFKKSDIALELYHFGVNAFQANNLEEAIDYMKLALSFDDKLADAYESLGVILGRIEKFEEAIVWMDKLTLVSPDSVMAHTNKSLYLMRLGKIEEAEAEKSLATIKSFAVFGQEAKQKKIILENIQKKDEEILRREKMFLQVLEIDDQDTIALFGIADILFQRKSFESAIFNLEKVIQVDPKYSTAYLLLGKALEASGNASKAQVTYQAGIIVASKRGDMMPANEMQSRLNQLIMGTSFN